MCRIAPLPRTLALAVLAAVPLAAQTPEPRAGTVAGSVRDARSAAPLPDATVTLDGGVLAAFPTAPRSTFAQATRATRTDTLGAYLFGGVTAGEYRLHVQRTGYRSATVLVALRSAGVEVEPVSLRRARHSDAPWRDLPRMIGAGYGAAYSGPTSGPGWHAQGSFAFHRASPALRAEAYALAQRGTATGSPLACGDQVRQLYCLGREDRSTFAGAGLALAVEGSIAGDRVRPYARLGGGVYHQRVASTEFEGPTGICIEGGELVSCPDNPPFGSFTRSFSRTGPGVAVAAGVRLRLLGVSVFAEAGTHAAEMGSGSAGAAPVTLGVEF
jgi:hypothetical protein